MSRIGIQPVEIPEKVNVEVDGKKVKVKGPQGNLEKELPREVSVKVEDGEVLVERKNDTKRAKSMHGTARAHIANMVKGVTEGWSKKLELVGTGYRAEVRGNKLVLTIGYSHPVEIEGPEGISFKVEKNVVTVEGPDKDLVGLIASKIRAVRPPEPYKGKGIKYIDEVVRRKPGKAAKATGTGAI